MEKTINEIELKAAVYDYIMSHILDKDFESVAAVADDVVRITLDVAKSKEVSNGIRE